MLSPVILGDNIFPSICCIIKIAIADHRHFESESISAINSIGIAPNMGPKYGIMLKIPFSIDKTIGSFIPNTKRTINVIMPIKKDKNIVCLLPDSGERYMSTPMFN